MLQTYSSNLAVEANAPFVFNNVVVDKGCGESLSAPSTIQLNKRGVSRNGWFCYPRRRDRSLRSALRQ